MPWLRGLVLRQGTGLCPYSEPHRYPIRPAYLRNQCRVCHLLGACLAATSLRREPLHRATFARSIPPLRNKQKEPSALHLLAGTVCGAQRTLRADDAIGAPLDVLAVLSEVPRFVQRRSSPSHAAQTPAFARRHGIVRLRHAPATSTVVLTAHEQLSQLFAHNLLAPLDCSQSCEITEAFAEHIVLGMSSSTLS